MNKNNITNERKKHFNMQIVNQFVNSAISSDELFYALKFEKSTRADKIFGHGMKWYRDYFDCNLFDFQSIVLSELESRGFKIDRRLGLVYINLC